MQYVHYKCNACNHETITQPLAAVTDGGWLEYEGAEDARFCAHCGSMTLRKDRIVHVERIFSVDVVS